MREWLKEEYPDLLVMDNLDDAIIGVVERIGTQAMCYSAKKIIEILMKEGMSEEDAWDNFQFNIANTWVGEHTPFILYDE
jgi:hypothetical protein